MFVSVAQSHFHAVNELRRNRHENQHGLQSRRVSEFYILQKDVLPVMLDVFLGRLTTQKQVERDSQCCVKVFFADRDGRFHHSFESDGNPAALFVADCLDTANEAAVIVAVPAVLALHFRDDGYLCAERQNL